MQMHEPGIVMLLNLGGISWRADPDSGLETVSSLKHEAVV